MRQSITADEPNAPRAFLLHIHATFPLSFVGVKSFRVSLFVKKAGKTTTAAKRKRYDSICLRDSRREGKSDVIRKRDFFSRALECSPLGAFLLYVTGLLAVVLLG